MRNIKDIKYLGMYFDDYDDLCNKLNYLKSLGYKSSGYSLKKYIKDSTNKYIYIGLHKNSISISKFFFSYDLFIDISEFKECKGYELEENRIYYRDVIERCLTMENMGL